MDTVKLIAEAVEEVEYITEEKEGGGKKLAGILAEKNKAEKQARLEAAKKE